MSTKRAQRERQRYSPTELLDAGAFALRMQAGPLPHWPAEVLKEWLHRHHGHIDERYFQLDFTTLRFARESWGLSRIPGREAMTHPECFVDSLESRGGAHLREVGWLDTCCCMAHGTRRYSC